MYSTINTATLSSTITERPNVNFNTGTAPFVLDAILSNIKIYKRRERQSRKSKRMGIQCEKKLNKTLK